MAFKLNDLSLTADCAVTGVQETQDGVEITLLVTRTLRHQVQGLLQHAGSFEVVTTPTGGALTVDATEHGTNTILLTPDTGAQAEMVEQSWYCCERVQDQWDGPHRAQVRARFRRIAGEHEAEGTASGVSTLLAGDFS